MLAWRKSGEKLELAEVELPEPGPDDALVKIEAISLNRGEVRMATLAKEAVVPGWDVGGRVVRAARSGTGPAAGSRVVGLLSRGGWAEYAAVPARHLAVIPDEVNMVAAVTLPVAGLTILRAFGVAGSLIGRRVLITGASGGVGALAVQLAAISGAHVTAVSRTAAAVQGVVACEIVPSIDDAAGEFDLILESVGGESLAKAIARAARGATVVTIGNSSEQETTFNARTLYGKGGVSIYGLLVFEEVEGGRVGARELSFLLELVRSGRLVPLIEVRRTWRDLPQVLADLEQRRFRGKAVLSVR